MLVLSRRSGQTITITLDPKIDSNTPIGELLSDRAIEFKVCNVQNSQAWPGFLPSPYLLILRKEINQADLPNIHQQS